MPEITIYAKSTCPYCHAAKAMLKRKGLTYTEIDVTYDREGQKAMAARANGRSTVPQIFIGEKHIGGCDDIHALEASGGLDALLKD